MTRSPGFAIDGLKRPLASQSWLWEMQGTGWSGRVEEILDAAADAGLQGVELTMAAAGRFIDLPKALGREIEARGLSFACLRYSMSTGFTRADDEQAEMAGLELAIRFACEAGTERLGLKGPSDPQPNVDHRAKLDHACRICERAARRAAEEGLTVNIHVHSHPDALLVTAEDLDLFLSGSDPETVFICADTGHLLRCGHNPAETIKRFLPRISHVHLKDAAADGSFPPLGAGMLDLAGVVEGLVDGGYAGWIVLEEEHESQISDPASALARAAELIRSAGWAVA